MLRSSGFLWPVRTPVDERQEHLVAYPHSGVPEFLHMDASEVAWELAVEAPECAAYLAGANFSSGIEKSQMAYCQRGTSTGIWKWACGPVNSFPYRFALQVLHQPP